jgi:hypothetical protein
VDTLTNPLYLGASIILGAISFILLTAGLRSRNLTMALWGVAFGAPSYAPSEPVFWALGIVFGVFAYKAGQL